MKKSSIIATFLCLVALVSCNKKTSTTQDQNNSAEQSAIAFTNVKDSISSEFTENKINIDYPTQGSENFLISVRTAIYNALNYNPFIESGKIASYNGDKNDTKQIAQYYLTKKVPTQLDKDEKARLKEMDAKYYCNDEIKVSYQGTNITSMYFSNYNDMVGAHGAQSISSAVFDNQSGQTYGWEIIKDTNQFKSYIINGLKEYFKVKTEKEVNNNLLEVNTKNIPLPECKPYFTEKGLKIIYNQYEIAPYASGMPSFVIPWDKCSEVLSKDILEKVQTDIEKNKK